MTEFDDNQQKEEFMKSKVGRLILLAMAMVFFFTSCAGKTDSSTQAGQESQKKVVRIAISENQVSMDPLNPVTFPGRITTLNVFEPLVEFDHGGLSGEFTPCLATSWEHDETGTKWTFHLREGVKFHNGEEFDSADVVATYQRLIDETTSLSVYSQFWAYLESVRAVDKYTVELTTTEPFATTLISVAYTPIFPNEAYAALGDALWQDKYMYGTGPWLMREWVDGAHTRFAKNTEYWNIANYDTQFEEMYIRYILEPSSAVASHLSGDVDAYVTSNGIDIEMLPLYNGRSNITELITMDTGTFNYIGFNCADDKVFGDLNTRLAFEYAIDRQEICDYILGGGAKVPNSVMLDTIPGYNPDLPPYEYNPEKAREYLAKSSYAGQKIVLYGPAGLLKGQDQLLAMSEMMNAVGFNTSVSVVERATYNGIRNSGDYDMFIGNDMPAGGDLAKYFSQKILTDSHHHNFNNPRMMELVQNIMTEMDVENRNGYLKEYAALTREFAAPHSILAQFKCTYAVDYGLTGIDLWKDGTYGFKYVDFDETLLKN